MYCVTSKCHQDSKPRTKTKLKVYWKSLVQTKVNSPHMPSKGHITHISQGT